ncbi:MAG: glutaredoxin family protein [Chromatiaceae bacterium]|nr:glutaredoxin family protein [Chromatiaceae bacterium]
MRKRASSIFLLLFVCVALSNAAHAEIYRWVDENGKVHFSDKPSWSHSSEQVTLRINTYEGVTYDTSSIDVGAKKVVMYSASWCGVCKKAKRYFAEKGVTYTEYDVEKSVEGKSAFKKLGGKGVPVILVGSRRMNGFSIDGFEKLYQ